MHVPISIPLLDNPLFKEEKKKTMPWIRDADLLDGTTEILKQEEVKFWNELIDTYLFPLEGDKKQQEKIQDELVELRCVQQDGDQARYYKTVCMLNSNVHEIYPAHIC